MLTYFCQSVQFEPLCFLFSSFQQLWSLKKTYFDIKCSTFPSERSLWGRPHLSEIRGRIFLGQPRRRPQESRRWGHLRRGKVQPDGHRGRGAARLKDCPQGIHQGQRRGQRGCSGLRGRRCDKVLKFPAVRFIVGAQNHSVWLRRIIWPDWATF